ncbi:MAG: disulfide bond formation protein B [Planctomycetes bacterium]|nr:disulfide bond formation protein B [Planctomycetota bacterium]
MTNELPSESSDLDAAVLWTRCALFVAVVGVLGSLHLSMGMNLRACPLCFYQRAFMMAAAGALAFGPFLPGMPSAAQTVLALPSVIAGAGIAGWHIYLEWNEKLECPVGITGVLTAPGESLIVFGLLVVLLLGDLFHQRKYVMQGVGAILLGVVFAVTSVHGVPDRPTGPHPAPLDGCRKYVP